MQKGKYVVYEDDEPISVGVEDDGGNEMELPIDYYEQKGYQPPWQTLPQKAS